VDRRRPRLWRIWSCSRSCTVIGGGIISNGRVLRGYVGDWRASSATSPWCRMAIRAGCGKPGLPLEKHASATAVVAMAHMLHLGENVTSKDVYALAREAGEVGEKAREIWRVVGESLGVALASLVNTFNFPLLPAEWRDACRRGNSSRPPCWRTLEQRSYTYRATKDETRVAQATLGNEAGVVRRGTPALVGDVGWNLIRPAPQASADRKACADHREQDQVALAEVSPAGWRRAWPRGRVAAVVLP